MEVGVGLKLSCSRFLRLCVPQPHCQSEGTGCKLFGWLSRVMLRWHRCLHAKPVETHTKLIQSVLFPHHLALNLLPSHPSHLTQQLLHTVLVLSFQSLCLRVFLFSPFISLWRSLTLMPPAVIAPLLSVKKVFKLLFLGEMELI